MKIKTVAIHLALILATLATLVRAQTPPTQTLSQLVWQAIEGQVVSGQPIPPGAVIHNGNGNTELTAAMVQSGADAAHPNVYENYTVHKGTLSIANAHDVIIVKCDIGGFGPQFAVSLNNDTDVWIAGNKIHDDNGGGVGASPTTLIDCHVDGNVFTNVGECVHLDLGTSGLSHDDSVSYNVMNSNTRYAIEIQGDISGGLKVMHNYGGGMSIATQSSPVNSAGVVTDPTQGGKPKAYTKGNEIAYNTLLGNLNKPGNQQGALEVYGAAANIHDNYFGGGWASGVYWSATGWFQNTPWYITNNIFVGVRSPWNYEGFLPTVNLAPTVSGNQMFVATDIKAPPIPTIAHTQGGVPVQPPTPLFKATPTVAGVQFHFTPVTTVAATMTVTATGGTDNPISAPRMTAILKPDGTVVPAEVYVYAIPTGTSDFVATDMPSAWKMYATLSGSSFSSLFTVAADQVSPATQPTTVPTTLPSVLPVLIGHSRDGVDWTTDATVQP